MTNHLTNTMTKEQFLQGVENWDNHRYLLWHALEATTGDVVEMGMGHGSTPFLREYCKDAGRMLYSYENNFEWFKKFQHLTDELHKVQHVTDWDEVSISHPSPSVVLIDHAPGERRHIDVERFSKTAQIIVIHDSEPAATGYMMDKIWGLFKYRRDHKSPGAWASMVSNFMKV